MKTRLTIPNYKETVLICQGGGALGSYQAGVYEGLSNHGIQPTWVAGISIGALNSCIIAGNAAENRVEKLKEFWDSICRPRSHMHVTLKQMHDMVGHYTPDLANKFKFMSDAVFGTMAAWEAILFGQKNFFTPKIGAPGYGNPKDIGYYDTTPMIRTLERLADFDRINHSGEMRVSLGSTNVRTGNFVYFDNKYMILRPEHFVASGSLPEGFPATEIDGEFYWDGGIVSNTPLAYVMTETKNQDILVFQVDLWSSEGSLPTNIFQVEERIKDIKYSSRTRNITQYVRDMHDMKKVISEMLMQIPEDVKNKNPYFAEIKKFAESGRTNVVHLIYRKAPSENNNKDIEFSLETKEVHWETGLKDADMTLADDSCLEMPKVGESFVTYDIHRRTRTTAQNQEPIFANIIKDKYVSKPKSNPKKN